MKLILLGAPGAGKGTQAEVLSARYQIPTISTGAIIRADIRNGTALGKQAKKLIDDGNLVPDEVVIDMVKERIAAPDCANGFILDGFPRTIAQAEALDTMCKIDCVLSIEVADDVIIARLSGRRECPHCSATYHTEFHPPVTAGICDKCGAELTTRADDQPETVSKRLAVYHKQTEPLKAYYEALGRLQKVCGKDEIADTTKEVIRVLEAAL